MGNSSQALRERQPDIREKILSDTHTSSKNLCTSNLLNSDHFENPSSILKMCSKNNRGIGNWFSKSCPTKNESPNISHFQNISSSARAAIEMLNEPSQEKISKSEEEEVVQLICETFGTPPHIPKTKHVMCDTEKPLVRKLYDEGGKGIEFECPNNVSNKQARKELKPNYFLNQAA